MDKQFRVRWEIDVWDETPTGAVYQAAKYAEKAAMRSAYEVREVQSDGKILKPDLVDLEEVLLQAEAQ